MIAPAQLELLNTAPSSGTLLEPIRRRVSKAQAQAVALLEAMDTETQSTMLWDELHQIVQGEATPSQADALLAVRYTRAALAEAEQVTGGFNVWSLHDLARHVKHVRRLLLALEELASNLEALHLAEGCELAQAVAAIMGHAAVDCARCAGRGWLARRLEPLLMTSDHGVACITTQTHWCPTCAGTGRLIAQQQEARQ